MMALALNELEKLASKSATEAITFDRQGLKGMAIPKYQRAIEILTKLCSLYPQATQNKVYLEYIGQYQQRIKELKGYAPYEGEAWKTEQKYDGKVLREKPNVSWGDVIGLTDAKRAIRDSIIYPFKRPDFFPLGWPRGILLFGPPGCGKTLLAAATATEIDAAFYNIDAASIMSKWLGESERNVAQLFETARLVSENGQPAIIFIDELDSLIGIRSEEVGGEVRMRNQFMKEMDGVTDKNKKLHVYVVGATNKPWSLDGPFLRRFQKRIFIPIPEQDARREILILYGKKLFNMGTDIDFLELAKATHGYSASDLYDVVQAVHLKVVREYFESHTASDTTATLRPIHMSDFLAVLQERKPSISMNTLNLYEKWYERFKAL
jgi:SpoVK/Ycf46/Vps4 family AAA+-type ATPase